MRTIKFRAWDKKKKEMNDLQDLNLIIYNGDVGSGFHADDEWGNVFLSKNVVLMQYTGLKDKNGKEIYCSDLLKDQKGQVGEVFWRDGGAAWGVRWKMLDGSWETDDYINESLEIIGNIYEHKELL